MATGERDNEFFNDVSETRSSIKDLSLANFTVGDLTALLGILSLREGISRGFHPSVEDLLRIKERLQNPIEKDDQSKIS